MLHSTSKYAFGDFSGAPNGALKELTSDPKAYRSGYFMPNSHDKQISDLRNWISKKAGGGVKWASSALSHGLPARLSSAALFDVYDAHTKNCKHCMAALRNL
jgi:hypothetical protein